jgi:leader peptidase (prepilin peptidase)/N-methyltransferase
LFDFSNSFFESFLVLAPFFLFILGAMLGSFANVVIYRWPKKESVVFPRSQCSACHKQIAFYDNIPILSWFLLRGRCRHCGASFSFRYCFIEILMGSLYVLVFHFVGPSWLCLEYLIFLTGLVTASFIDIDHFLLPDVITIPGVIIGLIGAFLNPERELWDALMGVLFGGGFLWAIAHAYFLLRRQEGMGGGDIKLLAWIGAVLGWKAIPFVILAASIFGTILGLLLSAQNYKGLKTAIPFGPYLALGALLYIFGGEAIAQAYIQFFIPGL